MDLFVLFDDVAFGSRGNWRHRNQLKINGRLRWLTIPVKARQDQPIDEILIDSGDSNWKSRHEALIRESLGKAPFFHDVMEVWEPAVSGGETRLSALNVRLLRSVCDYLGIRVPIVWANDYGASGSKTARLIDLLKRIGADTYLSGPSAAGYIDETMFRDNHLRLEYKTYDYPPYPQAFGEFIGTVSILDLIAHTGPQAGRYLQSRTPDRVAVP